MYKPKLNLTLLFIIFTLSKRSKLVIYAISSIERPLYFDEYVKSKINASYVSNLEDWIDTMPNIRLVLSGHVHCRKDLIIGKNNTRYIINACGYIPRNEPFKAPKFNPNLIIDTNNL